ncbi:MAG: DNA polymerase III subunit delta [Legionellales bacterium]|nr:DNA polymerase III subunit delta [Legionellales bacterium]
MKIYYNQIKENLDKKINDFYFIYGSPENLIIEVQEMIEETAIGKGFTIEKYFSDSKFDPDNLLLSLDNLELFNQKRLIEIHILEGKLSKKIIDFIISILNKKIKDVICLVKASLLKNSDIPVKLTRIFSSKGIIIPVYELKIWQKEKWLQNKADKLKLSLSDEAKLKILDYMGDSTESGNQILTSLQLAFGTAPIDKDNIFFTADQNITGSSLNLIEYCLNGNTNKALALLNKIKKENIDSTILLWSISLEIRKLSLAAKELCEGKNIKEIINHSNSFIKNSYTKALQRLGYKQILTIISRLSYIDKINKGTILGNYWLELEEIVLSLSGNQILPAFIKIKTTNN